MLKKCNSYALENVLLAFYNLILSNKKLPKHFNTSIISPIIKDPKKDLNDVNNIRPISISNSLSQIFEKLILFKSPKLTKTNNNQFGFKSKSSCDQAIFVVKETISNYIDKGTKCRIVALDAEKAFDKVWRHGMFYKLIDKLNPHIWSLLKQYYDASYGLVKLNGSLSNPFSIGCGVKQGGILSPYLFNIYMDDLIVECLSQNIGALVGSLNLSIIMYADDIILISSIDNHLQTLLNICEQFASKWYIKFNT